MDKSDDVSRLRRKLRAQRQTGGVETVSAAPGPSLSKGRRRSPSAKWRARVERDLPDFIDLVAVCVEAGLGFDAAVHEICREFKGPIAEEFAEALREMTGGKDRSLALTEMAQRLRLPDLTKALNSLAVLERLSTSVGNVLRLQAQDLRLSRLQRAEEMAAKLPVKLAVGNLSIVPVALLTLLGFLTVSLWEGLGLLLLAGLLWSPLLVLGRLRSHRLTLERQLAQALSSIANALRMGHPFGQAVANLAEDALPPLGDQLRILSRALLRNEPLEDAMRRFAEAAKSRDADLVVTAVLLQSRVGGSLATLLSDLSDTLRERVRVRGKVQALTAQARFSVAVMGLVPLGLGALLWATRLLGVPLVNEMAGSVKQIVSFGTGAVLLAYALEAQAMAQAQLQVRRIEALVP